MGDESYKKTFSKNLNFFMDLNNKTQMDLMNDLHLSSSTVSNWCTGLKLPRMDKIQLLADYFHINKSDLLEEFDPKLNEKKKETWILIECYSQLNNDGRKRLQAYAENLLNLQRADESVSTPSKVVDIPEHLISNAAHDAGATPEQKANADRIMMDDDEWK